MLRLHRCVHSTERNETIHGNQNRGFGPSNRGFDFSNLPSSERGFETAPFPDSCGLLEAITNDEIKIVFIDVDDPDDEGASLIKKIKEFDATIQVIATTSSARLIQAVRAFKLGASDYIFRLRDDPDRIDHAIWLCLEKFKWWADIFKTVANSRDA